MKEAEKPKPKPKEGRSTFDELLEQSRTLSEQSAKPKLTQRTAAKQALPETDHLKERQKERRRDSDDKEDQQRDSKGERREGQEGGKRVVAKQGTRQQDSDGKGSNSHEGGMTRRRGEKSRLLFKSGLPHKAAIGSHAFAKQFQEKIRQAAASHPKAIPQDILNQVIRHVRLGQKADGTHVFEFRCRESLFAGLSLRFEARDGKVNLTFLTASRSVKALFEKEAGAIGALLTQKGIAVETITVS